MKVIWRIVSMLALVLFVLGLVAIAIGLFSGGSLDRMLQVLFGGRDSFMLIVELLGRELASLGRSIVAAFM